MTENIENEEMEEISEKVEYEPKSKYEKALYSVYKNDTLCEIMRISSYVIVFLAVYAFISRIVLLIEKSPLEIFELLIITGVPFLAVSILRRFINAPRPYELLEFYDKKPKSKAGRSFPSRHVFSIFIIGTVLIPWNAFIGVGLLLLGAALAVLRVFLGIHFIRDVVAGAIIGVVCGVIGLLVTLI